MTRHSLELDYSKLPPGSNDLLVTWLKENGLKAENIPTRGAYVVRSVLDGGWVLVARRYVRGTDGHKLLRKLGDGYQTTIPVTAPVSQPPAFVVRDYVGDAAERLARGAHLPLPRAMEIVHEAVRCFGLDVDRPIVLDLRTITAGSAFSHATLEFSNVPE